jgi:hypothetical protein
MNNDDVLSGKAGLAGIQQIINGQASRRQLRREVQEMLRPGYRAGLFHLTRVKFKPGRKLQVYFTLPTIDGSGAASHLIHLAVSWQTDPNGSHVVYGRERLQEEADQSGLMPVQRALWREIPEQGLKLELWPFDPEFPQLVRLGNPSYVTKMFTSLGIAHDSKQLPTITPIRYRPKERHVLRYRISSPESASGAELLLYAKLYSDAEDAARAFGVANRVVDWLTTNQVGVDGNRPQVVSQEDGVILYPHASGVPLSHQLHRSRRWLSTQLQTIGRGLSVLHNGPESLQVGLKQNDFAKEAKVVKRASEHIQVLLPATYDKILEILDKAQKYYSQLPQERPTFTHADFKSDHLLSTPHGLTLIDFDTCTLTDPALDVGKFLADLDWWFAVKGIAGVEDAQAELLKGYMGEAHADAAYAMYERLARAKLFHALILTKIIVRRVPLYKKDWGETTSRMVERAAQVLQISMKA